MDRWRLGSWEGVGSLLRETCGGEGSFAGDFGAGDSSFWDVTGGGTGDCDGIETTSRSLSACGATVICDSGWLSSMTFGTTRRFLEALGSSGVSSEPDWVFGGDGVACFFTVSVTGSRDEWDVDFEGITTLKEDLRLLVFLRRVGEVASFTIGRFWEGVYSEVCVSGFPRCWGVAVDWRDEGFRRVAIMSNHKRRDIPDRGVFCPLGTGVLAIEIGVGRFPETEGRFWFSDFALDWACFTFPFQVLRSAGEQFFRGSYTLMVIQRHVVTQDGS